MPTNRKYRGHRAQALGPLELEHLASGSDHLLAGAEVCRLCRDGIGASDWQAGRDAVMRDWRGLGFPFPCLAQCVFDGETLPTLDTSWRDLYRWTWGMIADQLAALDVRRIAGNA